MEENKDQEKIVNNNKKSNKIVTCIIMICLFLMGFGIGFFISNSGSEKEEKGKEENNTQTENQKNEDNNEPTNNEQTNIDGNDIVGPIDQNKTVDEQPDSSGNSQETSKKQWTINDPEVLELYGNFHGDNSISGSKDNLTMLQFEYYIYKSSSFEVKNMKEITASLSWIIKDKISDKVNKYKKENNNEPYVLEKDIEEDIKKVFYEMFGDNLKFNHNLFASCNTLHYNNGKYYLNANCGDTSDIKVAYELTSVEADDNNLYLFETVKFTNDNSNMFINGLYKWTFNKGIDNKYHLLKVELAEY